MVRQAVEAFFPRLKGTDWRVTSSATTQYNCVAWAADDTERWWWPTASYYWPNGIERVATVGAFERLFSVLGYEACDGSAEPQLRERIAVFVRDTRVTHVARQLESGLWTSKLGRLVDIMHSLHDLEGDSYGQVETVMCRGRAGAAQ